MDYYYAAGGRLPSFLLKTFDMVEDPKTDSLISWSSSGKSLIIWDHNRFTSELLSKHFKTDNFASFVSQLHNYGFRKVAYDRHEYANALFQSGKKHMLKDIKRKSQAPKNMNKRGHVSALVHDPVTSWKETELNAMMTEQNGMKQEIQCLKHSLENMAHQLESLRSNHLTLPEPEDESTNRADYINKLFELLQERRDQSSGCNTKTTRSSNQDQTMENASEIAATCDIWTNILNDEDEREKGDVTAQYSKAMMIFDEMRETEFATGKAISIADPSYLNEYEDGPFELWA